MSFPPNLGITSSFIIDSGSSSVFQEFPSLLPQLERICSPFSRSKMSKYSRIRGSSTTRSKSVDFGDLSFPHHSPRSTASFYSSSSTKYKSQEEKPRITTIHASIPEHEDEGTGEVFGIILNRKCAVSSAPVDQKVVVAVQESLSSQASVKRSFSIKRSASVSEAYSRIHHQSDLNAEDDDLDETAFTHQNRDVKKKGKFLKAFRRLFRL